MNDFSGLTGMLGGKSIPMQRNVQLYGDVACCWILSSAEGDTRFQYSTHTGCDRSGQCLYGKEQLQFSPLLQLSICPYKGKMKSEVTLRFTPEKAKWVQEQVWHRNQKRSMSSDGSPELSFPVADFAELTMEILKKDGGFFRCDSRGSYAYCSFS
jgi:hypothetical protein